MLVWYALVWYAVALKIGVYKIAKFSFYIWIPDRRSFTSDSASLLCIHVGMHQYNEKMNLVANCSVINIQWENITCNDEMDRVWKDTVHISA